CRDWQLNRLRSRSGPPVFLRLQSRRSSSGLRLGGCLQLTLAVSVLNLKHLFDRSGKCRTPAIRQYRTFVRSNENTIEHRYDRTVIRRAGGQDERDERGGGGLPGRGGPAGGGSDAAACQRDNGGARQRDCSGQGRPHVSCTACHDGPDGSTTCCDSGAACRDGAVCRDRAAKPDDRGAALAAGPAWPAPAMVSRAVQGPSSRGPGRGPAPVRLTRRGRVVLTALIAAVAIVVVTLLCTGAAGGAQASSQHGPARAGYQGMTQIVVQPGQTLWSIALSAEPSANTQTVVQQIADANALGGTSLKAGQLLWVPKG